ncbi:hypothetical protein G4G28_07530 [Massilia sp. Dwa41.01b]|nr:hypothetical protein [Massilia sp. Dwa41.01b]QNA88386.1 hypothetical protein G4G28_07530 [Massilia sp. Dwa41.01b]
MAWLGLTGIVLVLGWSDLVHRHLFKSGLVVLCLGTCALLLACHAHPPRARHGLGWLARMGSLSYELYLSHMFLVLGTVALYRALLGEVQTWTFLVYLPLLLCCNLLARLLERLIARPSPR